MTTVPAFGAPPVAPPAPDATAPAGRSSSGKAAASTRKDFAAMVATFLAGGQPGDAAGTSGEGDAAEDAPGDAAATLQAALAALVGGVPGASAPRCEPTPETSADGADPATVAAAAAAAAGALPIVAVPTAAGAADTDAATGAASPVPAATAAAAAPTAGVVGDPAALQAALAATGSGPGTGGTTTATPGPGTGPVEPAAVDPAARRLVPGEATDPTAVAPIAEEGTAPETPGAVDAGGPVAEPQTPGPVAGPQHVRAPERTEAAAAPAVPTAPTPTPGHQVAEMVRPLHRLGDGTYRMSLRLTPDELGPVTIEVAVRNGTMSVHMVGETAAAREALSASLADLRADLEGAGLRTGFLEVGGRGPQDRRPEHAFAARMAGAARGDDDSAAITPLTRTTPSLLPAGDGRVDVRI